MTLAPKLTPMYLCVPCNIYLPVLQYTKHLNGKHKS